VEREGEGEGEGQRDLARERIQRISLTNNINSRRTATAAGGGAGQCGMKAARSWGEGWERSLKKMWEKMGSCLPVP